MISGSTYEMSVPVLCGPWDMGTWYSPSTGAAVVGCRDIVLWRGSSVGKRSCVKLLGQMRQYRVRPEPCIRAGGPTPAARWPVALVQGLQPCECDLCIMAAPLANATMPLVRDDFVGFSYTFEFNLQLGERQTR